MQAPAVRDVEPERVVVVDHQQLAPGRRAPVRALGARVQVVRAAGVAQQRSVLGSPLSARRTSYQRSQSASVIATSRSRPSTGCRPRRCPGRPGAGRTAGGRGAGGTARGAWRGAGASRRAARDDVALVVCALVGHEEWRSPCLRSSRRRRQVTHADLRQERLALAAAARPACRRADRPAAEARQQRARLTREQHAVEHQDRAGASATRSASVPRSGHRLAHFGRAGSRRRRPTAPRSATATAMRTTRATRRAES